MSGWARGIVYAAIPFSGIITGDHAAKQLKISDLAGCDTFTLFQVGPAQLPEFRDMVPDTFYAPSHRICGGREIIPRPPRKGK
jgi:hypothetical protein